MPWKKLDIDAEIQKECDASPEFKKMWEESREEYRLVGEMIRLRKQHNLTQRQLAQLAGKKQQIILFIDNVALTSHPDFNYGVPKIVCNCSTEAEIIPKNLIRVMPA